MRDPTTALFFFIVFLGQKVDLKYVFAALLTVGFSGLGI